MNEISFEEKMELNHLLNELSSEELTEKNWKEIAKKAIELARKLPITNGEADLQSSRGQDSSISGFTNEFGNVDIQEKGEDKNETKLVFTQDSSYRIGNYRVDVFASRINFVNFWKSSILTSADEESPIIPFHVLLFNKKTDAPVCFGIEEYKTKFHFDFFFFKYRKFYLLMKVIYGNKKYNNMVLGRFSFKIS